MATQHGRQHPFLLVLHRPVSVRKRETGKSDSWTAHSPKCHLLQGSAELQETYSPYACVHTHTHTRTNMLEHQPSHKGSRTQVHTKSHIPTQIPPAYMLTHLHLCIHPHACSQQLPYLTHTHTHARTHTHTHARAYKRHLRSSSQETESEVAICRQEIYWEELLRAATCKGVREARLS